MTVATYSLTAGAIAARKTLIDLTHCAGSSAPIIGAAKDVSAKMGGIVVIRFGRRSASAAGAGAKIIIQASPSTDGAIWSDLYTYTTDFAACASQAVSSNAAAAQKVISVAATANLPVQTPIFIANSSQGNSEWHVTQALTTNTNITTRDDLDYAQSTSSTIYTAAEMPTPIRFPAGIARLRAVHDPLVFTQNHAVEVWFTTLDGIG